MEAGKQWGAKWEAEHHQIFKFFLLFPNPHALNVSLNPKTGIFPLYQTEQMKQILMEFLLYAIPYVKL